VLWLSTHSRISPEFRLGPSEQPIVHSDRGGHYRWPGWLERTDNARLPRAMSRKGYSPDNAACEAFFGRLKTEFFIQGIGAIQHSSI
jgi:transposase InsO family protein